MQVLRVSPREWLKSLADTGMLFEHVPTIREALEFLGLYDYGLVVTDLVLADGDAVGICAIHDTGWHRGIEPGCAAGPNRR
jgi:hypothetical protein